MKTKFTLYIILLLNLSCNSKSKDNLENNKTVNKIATESNTESVTIFEKNYIGTINNKLDFIFHLKKVNGEMSGFYFYANQGIEIKLKGKISNNTIHLDELDFFNNKVAEIKLETNGKNLSGEWTNSKNNKSFKIDLKETEKEIKKLPKNIEGIYKATSNEGEYGTCNLTVKLYEKNGEYYYNFQSKIRKLSGKVRFSRYIDDNETYIVLEGIEWSEYSGDVSKQDDENYIEPDLALPTEIEGSFSENEITIQNYGNAMNYYVKLNDCDAKYIYLKKQQ